MIVCSKLPVLWATKQKSNKTIILREKKNPFSSLSRFVHLYWKVTQCREKKVCFLLLAFFLSEFSNQIFLQCLEEILQFFLRVTGFLLFIYISSKGPYFCH